MSHWVRAQPSHAPLPACPCRRGAGLLPAGLRLRVCAECGGRCRGGTPHGKRRRGRWVPRRPGSGSVWWRWQPWGACGVGCAGWPCWGGGGRQGAGGERQPARHWRDERPCGGAHSCHNATFQAPPAMPLAPALQTPHSASPTSPTFRSATARAPPSGLRCRGRRWAWPVL